MCKYIKHCKYCRCLKIFLLVFIWRCKRKIHQTVGEAWCKHILSIWLRWHHIFCVHRWFFSHWKWNWSHGSDEKRLSEWGETTSRAVLLSGRWAPVSLCWWWLWWWWWWGDLPFRYLRSKLETFTWLQPNLTLAAGLEMCGGCLRRRPNCGLEFTWRTNN